MEQLLENVARRSARYLADLQERAVAASPEAVARLTTLREPLPAGPSDAADVAGAARRDRLAGDHGHGRAALLRLRHRRLAAGRAGRQLARGRLGSERGLRLRHARRRHARGRRAGMAQGRARAARELRGRVRHRRHDGQLQRARRGPPRRARRSGLGRRGRRAVRCAADHGRDRRGGAPDADQGARARRLRAQPARARARRRPGAHARRSAAAAHGGHDRVRAGRQRQHGRVRSAGRDRRAHARGRRMAARRRRVRPVGGRGSRGERTCSPAPSWPTPGRRTPTSGSTSPTTAASPSCATPMRCAPRWPSPPSTCLLRSGVRNPSDYTPELSRRARGVEVWAALRSLGARAWTIWSSGVPARRRASPKGSPRPATRSSTTSCSTRCWSRSASRRRPSA